MVDKGVVQQMRLTALHNFYILTFVSQSRKESLLSVAVNVVFSFL